MEVSEEAVVDDFEQVNHRWSMDGWSRTDDVVQQGSWSLCDRDDAAVDPSKKRVEDHLYSGFTGSAVFPLAKGSNLGVGHGSGWCRALYQLAAQSD